jgi:hypothetical protein
VPDYNVEDRVAQLEKVAMYLVLNDLAGLRYSVAVSGDKLEEAIRVLDEIGARQKQIIDLLGLDDE